MWREGEGAGGREGAVNAAVNVAGCRDGGESRASGRIRGGADVLRCNEVQFWLHSPTNTFPSRKKDLGMRTNCLTPLCFYAMIGHDSSSTSSHGSRRSR